MSASLVGSEMCIRDRALEGPRGRPRQGLSRACAVTGELLVEVIDELRLCLLYTSDAADDM
eukprot:11832975-Alexandrium_andersonii.AAC.1